MSDQSKSSQSRKVVTPKGRKKRSFWRWLLWVLLGLFVLCCILALILWVKRYDIVESQVENELERAGIEASLDIKRVSSTQAIVDDVVLSFEGQEFLKADRLELQYTFEKVRAGELDKIVLMSPQLTLNLSEDGTIIDEWLPEPSGEESQIAFPIDGIIIENGLIDWTAPFGTGQVKADAQIESATKWQARLSTDTGEYRTQDIDVAFAFDGNLERKNNTELLIDGILDAEKIRVRESFADTMKADFNVEFKSDNESDDLQFSGELDVTAHAAYMPSFSAGRHAGVFKFNGVFDQTQNNFSQFISDWDIEAEKLSLTDTDLRERLIRNTMSYEALSNTPIATHFVDYFERNGQAMLEEFSFKGEGTYVHDTSGYSLELDENAILESGEQKLIVKPGSGPEINYSSEEDLIDLNANIDWLGRRSLAFKNFSMTGLSDNGLVLTGVQNVKSRIKSTRTWSTAKDGNKIRLAPLDLGFEYTRDDSQGQVKLNGRIDYDGEVPGGIATGLVTRGRINLGLKGENFNLAYTPSNPVKVSEFVSDTGWKAENVSFEIADARNVLARIGAKRPFDIGLNNIKADIISPENDRHLAAQFNAMQVRSEFTDMPQKWDLDVQGIDMRSDDFPSPGTHIVSPVGKASVFQFADGHVEFDIDSPSTYVETENANIQDLSIQMAGLPNDFTAEYVAGKVKLKGSDEMPELPMAGTARLAAGELTGSAIAHLPESKETPINIAYKSNDGVGSAHITIPKIVFEPRGLQPQYVIPALRGRLAEVSGEASAEFEFAFSGGGPVSSFGFTKLKNMDIGTIVGPFTGVNADLNFNSIFPLQTSGIQTATLSGFDPGFPLNNGTVKFEMVPEGVRIHQAIWPVISVELEKGQVYVEPLLWRFGNVENKAVVQIENLSLGDIVDGLGNKDLSATGQIFGTLPVSVKGVEILVENGALAVKDGGVIRYKSQGIDTFVDDVKGGSIYGDQLEGAETGFAFKALENFQYKELEAKIDGPLDGEMSLRMAFDGKNPDVFFGTAFSFNVTIAGELANIVRSTAQAFSSDAHIDKLIELQNEELENGK